MLAFFNQEGQLDDLKGSVESNGRQAFSTRNISYREEGILDSIMRAGVKLELPQSRSCGS